MNNEKQTRDSNIELLRLVSMFLVLVVHADFKALGMPSLADCAAAPVGTFMRYLVESFSIVCVNVFILISGWFSIKFRFVRLGELLFQLLFICLLMFGFLALVGGAGELSLRAFVDDYWFVWAYVVLYLFAPALNSFVDTEPKKSVETFLLLFFLLQTLFGCLISTDWFSLGYSPLSFMGLYVLGRYMRLYPNRFTTQSRTVDLIAYMGMALLITFSVYLLHSLHIDPSKVYAYSSPLVIVESVSLFLFFTKLSFKSNVVNWLAVSCLSIFLVHCFPGFFERVYLYQIRAWFMGLDTLSFVLYTAVWILTFFFVPLLIDKLRIFIWRKLMTQA